MICKSCPACYCSEVLARLRTLLAYPEPETSRFVAAVSFLAHLAPEDVIPRLEDRINRLDEQIREMDTTLQQWVPRIGRLVVLETEYARAMRQVEKDWIQTLFIDLREGRLSWNVEAIFRCLWDM